MLKGLKCIREQLAHRLQMPKNILRVLIRGEGHVTKCWYAMSWDERSWILLNSSSDSLSSQHRLMVKVSPPLLPANQGKCLAHRTGWFLLDKTLYVVMAEELEALSVSPSLQ